MLHYPAFGGPHNRLVQVSEALRARGWDAAMALPEEPGNAVEWMRAAGLTVFQTPLSRLRKTRNLGVNLRMIRRLALEVEALRALIREYDPSVVIVSNLLMPHAGIAGRLENRAVVWQIVDTAVPTVLQVPAMGAVRGMADAVVFGGAALARHHLGASRLRQPRLVISPPVDSTVASSPTHRIAPPCGESSGSMTKPR